MFSPGHAVRELELSPRIGRMRAQVAAALFDDEPPCVTIGRYKLVRELGAGGMGLVFLAQDDQLARRVAIKLIHGDRASDEARARLQREAQAITSARWPSWRR